MRAASILTASIVLLGLTACGAGGGGGPSDLDLGGPTSGPVTTAAPTSSTTQPDTNGRAQVARARFAQLAVYETPDAAEPKRVLQNPWTPKGSPRDRIPQVLLVAAHQGDGWVKVLLPDTPQATEGWVRSFDVKITTVTYRMRVVLSRHSVRVFNKNRQIFQSPIRVTDAQQAGVVPGSFYLRRVEPARAMAMTDAYSYRFVASLVTRVPLGTPIEIMR